MHDTDFRPLPPKPAAPPPAPKPIAGRPNWYTDAKGEPYYIEPERKTEAAS